MSDPIEVWVDRRHVGDIAIERRAGFQHDSMAFTYRADWIADLSAFPISPDLPVQQGPQVPAAHRSTFVAFDDAAPDAWGRALILAAMREEARSAGRRFASPTETELLLRVRDETRQGALRFRSGDMSLGPGHSRAPFHDLHALAASAARFESTGEVDEDFAHLLGAGSAPGARARRRGCTPRSTACCSRSSRARATCSTCRRGSTRPRR